MNEWVYASKFLLVYLELQASLTLSWHQATFTHDLQDEAPWLLQKYVTRGLQIFTHRAWSHPITY